jgi:hypothetical protein
MIYRNRNGFENTFRYKKVDNNTNDYVGIINSKRIIKYTETENTNGKSFHYVPYDYHPRLFFKILWNLKAWYKRPKLKTIIENKINQTISKEIWLITRGVSIFIIGALIWGLYGSELIKFFTP